MWAQSAPTSRSHSDSQIVFLRMLSPLWLQNPSRVKSPVVTGSVMSDSLLQQSSGLMLAQRWATVCPTLNRHKVSVSGEEISRYHWFSNERDNYFPRNTGDIVLAMPWFNPYSAEIRLCKSCSPKGFFNLKSS